MQENAYPAFKLLEFEGVRISSGENAFTISPQKWIKSTNAIGITSKSGRYGGTYAHSDIAFEFASWISPEFKLYIIKDYQRLKKDEADRLAIGWDEKRAFSKINYHIHTDAVQKYLITDELTGAEIGYTFANEADIISPTGTALTEFLYLLNIGKDLQSLQMMPSTIMGTER